WRKHHETHPGLRGAHRRGRPRAVTRPDLARQADQADHLLCARGRARHPRARAPAEAHRGPGPAHRHPQPAPPPPQHPPPTAPPAPAGPGSSQGQPWPDKPIKLITSFAPGGVHDPLARVLQPKLTEALAQPIVIENRPGAGGNIAAEAVAKSAPDGSTFLVASEAIATNEFLYSGLAYDPYKDLAPVAKLADYPMAVIANPSVPANNMKELIALAKAKPGSLSYGSAGIGASGHLAGELLNSAEGIDLVHVPYKGGAPALADLVAGRIQVMFLSVSLSAPQVKQGRIKVLALTGTNHSDKLPGVTTTAE